MLRVNFWSKDTGNLLNHSSGLTQEQIIMLRDLKAGDRLILWLNRNGDTREPNYTLKVYQKKTEETQ